MNAANYTEDPEKVIRDWCDSSAFIAQLPIPPDRVQYESKSKANESKSAQNRLINEEYTNIYKDE